MDINSLIKDKENPSGKHSPGKKVSLGLKALLCAVLVLISPAHAAEKYQVVTTIGMITDIVRHVAGDQATVEGIISEGVDPHVYRPTTTDIRLLQGADVIFYNGLMLEGKMGDALVRVARRGKPVFAVTESIVEQQEGYLLTDEEEHFDPHVWMDVRGWIRAVDVVAESLSSYDAKNAAIYAQQAAAYKMELEKLDAYAKEVIATIPEERRMLVTAHDAFGYLARAYDIKVQGIQGMNTESEAGVKDVENLVTMLVEKQIPAIFVESSVSDKNVKALIEGAKAKGHTVVIGGELYSDAMGPEGSYEGTYIGMIDHNVTTIARALGGKAPEKGLNQKLGQ